MYTKDNRFRVKYVSQTIIFFVCLWLGVLLGGCGVASLDRPPDPAAPVSVPVSTQRPALPAPTSIPSEAVACDVRARGVGQPEARVEGITKSSNVRVEYDRPTNTITVAKGTVATLAALRQELSNKDMLRELAPGDWLLKANLVIEKGATLYVGGPDVQRLKLQSDPQAFVSIKVRGGKLTFANTCVTSWNTARNTFDDQYADGRSFILARDGAKMEVYQSELSYLGYDADESYGVAWRLKGTTGKLINSRLGYNFYGMYSNAASGLVIRGNEVHHSIRYGIDPHTGSNDLVIERNVSHHNGKHGIILAEKCSRSRIRDNIVYDNIMHGIVLYQDSNDNVVEGNTTYRNGLQGININDASNNTIRNNEVYNNTEAGIGIGQQAAKNTITGNNVYDNLQDGIVIYTDADKNVIRDNTVSDNQRYGIYVKSTGNKFDDNRVSGNRGADIEQQGS